MKHGHCDQVEQDLIESVTAGCVKVISPISRAVAASVTHLDQSKASAMDYIILQLQELRPQLWQ